MLPEYLATGFVAGEETFFRGVSALLPGHTLCVVAPATRPSPRRYWSLPAPTERARGRSSPRPAADDVRERLAGGGARAT